MTGIPLFSVLSYDSGDQSTTLHAVDTTHEMAELHCRAIYTDMLNKRQAGSSPFRVWIEELESDHLLGSSFTTFRGPGALGRVRGKLHG